MSGSILEGLDEMITVNRLRLPPELGRSLACTKAIENMQGHDPPRHMKREALARCLNGSTMAGGWNVGGKGGHPAIESLPAVAGTPASAGQAPLSPP